MLGRIINGYHIKEFIGKGSFGTVYRCEFDGNSYAIKVFSLDYVYSEYRKGNDNRIRREIAALKRVVGDSVVKYIDDGVFIDNGQEYVYIVMEYMEGEDLQNMLSSVGMFSVDYAVSVFKNILDGLSIIHNCSIVHRDLKPANVFIIKDGSVKIIDFGLSKLIDFTSITSTGDQIGTPLYMSPEQISDSKNIDYRSDYYSLGVMLYMMLTGESPYGNISSREELYYKIMMEPPIPLYIHIPTIDNSIDNLVNALLQKENYKRPNSVDAIKEYLEQKMVTQSSTKYSFDPAFYIRLWNEKNVLSEYYQDGNSVENVIFPVNHQKQQKNLLRFIMDKDINYIIDPSTMRLAYDSYSTVKGLIDLPYAPSDLTRLEISDLKEYEVKRKYVRQVIDEQMKYSPNSIVAPFHVSNNSNIVSIKNSQEETWFSLDVKLLNETKAYLNELNYSGELVGGFCIKDEILTNRSEKDYFLNVLSSLKCDKYLIYVDRIDTNSSVSILYNYAVSLLELQNTTGKPVIAGRVGQFGLVMLAMGLHGFESGVARFESFYEELYKDSTDNYNMYVRYYIPEILTSVAIERKNPIKIVKMLESATGHSISCKCPYCCGVASENLANDSLAKKHFLYRRGEEINEIRNINSKEERIKHMECRINNAISYYKELKPIFKDDDYRHLRTWKEVIERIR